MNLKIGKRVKLGHQSAHGDFSYVWKWQIKDRQGERVVVIITSHYRHDLHLVVKL